MRGAARELNVASSAVSRQIQALEESLGVGLFDRIGRGLRLSQAGEILFAHARRTIGDSEATFSELDALKGLRRGFVRVASVESVTEVMLPQIVGAFRAKFPGIHVDVVVTGSAMVADMVETAEADVGFTFEPPASPRLSVNFRRDMAIGCVMAPGHPLAEREALCLADCLAFPVALPAQGLSLRARIDATLGDKGETRRTFVESNSLRFMKALARSGACVAFQTRVGLEEDLLSGRLVFRALSDAPLQRDRFAIITSAHRGLALAPAMFFDYAVTELKKTLGPA